MDEQDDDFAGMHPDNTGDLEAEDGWLRHAERPDWEEEREWRH